MEKLSKEDERRVISALQSSVNLVNDGMHPNDAIAKIAEAQQFGPPLVQRMVEAMNVSKTLSHFKQASGARRADSFPLADASVIMEKLYPSEVIAPSTKEAAAYVPAELMKPGQQSFMKVSRALQPLPYKKAEIASYPQDPQIIANQVHATRRGLQTKVANAKSLYRAAFHKTMSLAEKVAEHFSLVTHEPWEVVEKKAYAEYGDLGRKMMDLVQVHSGKHIKRASYTARPSAIFDPSREPYKSLAKMAEAADEMNKLANEAVDQQMTLEAFEQKHGFVQPKQAAALSETLVPGFKKAAFDLGTSVASSLTNQVVTHAPKALGLSDPNSDSARRDALNDILDPEHEAALNSVKVKSMLNDFVSNDPILGSYDPTEVTAAYNHIAQLAPQTAMQPAVMRGMLRKILQQGGVMEPFEAHQVSEIEKRLMGLKVPPELEAKPKAP